MEHGLSGSEVGLVSDEAEMRKRLEDIANADIRKIIGPDNKLIAVADWPDDIAVAVHRLHMHTDGSVRTIELVERQKALDMLNRMDHRYQRKEKEKAGDSHPWTEFLEAANREDLRVIDRELKALQEAGASQPAPPVTVDDNVEE